MKNLPVFKKSLLILVILLIICTVPAWIFLIGQYARSHYYSLLSDEKLIQAFISQDETAIQGVIRSRNLEYQKFENGKIVYSSKYTLPFYKIQPIRNIVAANVIDINISDSLRQQVPYTIIREDALYVLFPIVLNDDGTHGYLVYSKVM